MEKVLSYIYALFLIVSIVWSIDKFRLMSVFIIPIISFSGMAGVGLITTLTTPLVSILVLITVIVLMTVDFFTSGAYNLSSSSSASYSNQEPRMGNNEQHEEGDYWRQQNSDKKDQEVEEIDTSAPANINWGNISKYNKHVRDVDGLGSETGKAKTATCSGVYGITEGKKYHIHRHSETRSNDRSLGSSMSYYVKNDFGEYVWIPEEFLQ